MSPTAVEFFQSDGNDNTVATSSKIDFYLANMNGLVTGGVNKCQDLELLTKTGDSQRILAITESWATDSHEDSEYEKYFPGFHIKRADRDVNYDEVSLKTRGGCMVIASPGVTTNRVDFWSNGNCEIIITEHPAIHLANIVIYRPSGKNYKLAKFEEILGRARCYLEKKREKHDGDTIILSGDFNFNDQIVTWEKSDEGLLPVHSEGSCPLKQGFSRLLDLVEDYDLHQIVDKNTREDQILDLIFTNNPECTTNCQVTELDPLSDHRLIHTTLSMINQVSSRSEDQRFDKPEISQYNFKADIEEVKKQMTQFNFDEVLDQCDVEQLHEEFSNSLCSIAKKSKLPSFKDNGKREGVPMSPVVRKRINKLNKERGKIEELLKAEDIRYEDMGKLQDRTKEINAEIHKWHESERERIEKKVCEEIKRSTKAFYNYANSFRKNKTKIGPLKSGGSFVNGEKEMADILSNQFESAFTKPADTNYYHFKHTICRTIEDIDITPEVIKEAMLAIKESSAPGPDGIVAFIFRTFAEELCRPIAKIWRRSLDAGKMPEGPIMAIIAPIYKSEDRSEPVNYRPVSLTNHLTKIFERVLRKHLVVHLEIQELMNKNQHGFRSGRSCLSQLLVYYDSILSMREEGHKVHSIYLDFAKAFDKVDHSILLKKVEGLGIKGKILAWIRTFLTTRSQKVRVGDSLSEAVKVLSGVPQGSVLGPLLFIIFMVDIDEDITDILIGTFADDTRAWQKSTSNFIQGELQKMYEWTRTNRGEFNGKKFEMMEFCSDDEDVDEEDPTTWGPPYLQPNGKTIRRKKNIKDLGVHMSSNCKFDFHINSVAKSGQNLSAWALRTFRTRTQIPMLTILKSLVVAKCEYGSILWSPTDRNSINKLESVQRRFTSKFARFRRDNDSSGLSECYVHYWTRLELLQIYSLERRRDRYMIFYMFKIHIGANPNPNDVFEYEYNARTKTKYFAKHNPNATRELQTIRRSSFYARGPLLFNVLPLELRDRVTVNSDEFEKTVASFKVKLDMWLELIPDRPGEPNSIPTQFTLHSKDINLKWRDIVRKHKKMFETNESEGDGRQRAEMQGRRNSLPHRQSNARVNRVW